MNTEKKAALYARVSTEEQAREGFSLSAQMEVMRAYCELHDIVVVKEYIDDGYSGRSTNRKAYREMFSPPERKEWNVLVVLKIDRIHRNSRNFMNMMDDLKRHGQEFISTMDKIDTSNAIGRFVMDMIQRIAQLESEQIGERTYLGMKEKATTGDGLMGFSPPYGYSVVDGKLESNEELGTVKSIFSMYGEGMSLNEIANELNRNGIHTRKGNTWTKFNVRNILHNPVYAGYTRWDGILTKHDAETAVSTEMFNIVQTQMSQKTRASNGCPGPTKVPT